MVVILLSTIAFSARLGGRNVYGLLGTFTAISIMLAIEVGMAPVLNRFIHQDPLQDSRWEIFNTTITAIGEFFPVGSGIGTFSQVFPRFQESGFNGTFVNRAHNDYLEWIMEGGIIAAILILLFLVLYISRWTKVIKRGEWRTFNFMQVGAGIGIFAMILHTFVDFNLHIPANQIYFAFLAALFFYQSSNEANAAPVEITPEAAKSSASDVLPIKVEKKSYVVKSTNPFAD
jgi:O-antigen ligase